MDTSFSDNDALLLTGARLALDAMPQAALLVDSGGRVICANRPAERLAGHRIRHLIPPGDSSCMDLSSSLQVLARSSVPGFVQVPFGGRKKVLFTGKRFGDMTVDGVPLVILTENLSARLIGMSVDANTAAVNGQNESERTKGRLRALRKEARRLQELNERDPLTRLLNTTAFAVRVRRSLDSDKVQRGILAYFDLNGFKLVNDEHGHLAGDTILKDAADRLRQACWPGGMAGRLGGDEFAIWFPLAKGHAPEPRIEELTALAPVLVPKGGSARPEVSAAVGFAVYPEDGTTYEGLVEVSDANMYRHKRLTTVQSRAV